MKFHKLMILLSIFILLLSSVSASKENHLSLDEQWRYSFEDGMFQKTCSLTAVNGIITCDMILNISKQPETTNATISFSAHEQNNTNSSHWYYVPFDTYISEFKIYEENNLGNGTLAWSEINSEESYTGILNQSNNVTVRRQYTWMQNISSIDIIPQYYVNETESFVYNEYAIFFEGGLNSSGDLMFYFPFDTAEGIVPPGELDSYGSMGNITDGVKYTNSSYAHDNGLLVNGSYHYVNQTGLEDALLIRQTWAPNAFMTTDDFSFGAWIKVDSIGTKQQIFLLVDNFPYIQIYIDVNGSVVLGGRSESGVGEFTSYMGVYQDYAPVNDWFHFGFTLNVTNPLPSATWDMTTYSNGTAMYTTVKTGMNGLFTSMNDCDLGDGICQFFNNKPANAAFNGSFDEVRLYRKVLSTSELVQLSNLTLLANIEAPTPPSPSVSPDTSGILIKNILTGVGTGLGLFLTFISDDMLEILILFSLVLIGSVLLPSIADRIKK